MAIFATRRKCEVTSLCAASISSLSRQRFERDSSSSGDSMGNLRISWRYRDRLPSGAMLRTAEATGGSFRRPRLDLPGMAQDCGWNVTETSPDAGGDHHVPETHPIVAARFPDVPIGEGH